MIYLVKFIKNLIEDEKGLRIGYIHNMPFHPVYGLKKSEEELREEGILLDDIPKPERVEGKIPVPYYNPETNTVYYEYVDRPLTPEEKAEQLEQAMIETSILLAELEQKERLNEQAILELSMLLAEGGNK